MLRYHLINLISLTLYDTVDAPVIYSCLSLFICRKRKAAQRKATDELSVCTETAPESKCETQTDIELQKYESVLPRQEDHVYREAPCGLATYENTANTNSVVYEIVE